MRPTRRQFLAATGIAWAAATLRPASAAAPRDEGALTRTGQAGFPIMSGAIGGTYLRAAADLARTISRPQELRLLPLVGAGSVQNITDLLYLQGIDVTFVQVDALNAMRDEKLYPGLDRRIRFVTKLFNEEVHVLAGNTVSSLADLGGRRVNFDVGGSGTAVTATSIFSSLGIAVEATLYDQPTALAGLRAGDIAALVYVAGKPVDLFQQIPAGAGLRLLPVPRTAQLLASYLPAQLDFSDYPNLIGRSAPLPTLAVGAAMVVYNWPPESERHRRVSRFVARFLERFDDLTRPPSHPKWQEVTLAATIPGWTRLAAAETWLAGAGRGR